MPNIPGFPAPIPGTPYYAPNSNSELSPSEYPMVYTTDGPIALGPGLAFTNDALVFDPGTAPDFGVMSVTGAYNNAGGITATPTEGDVVLFLNAATPVALGGVYGRTDPDGGTQNTFLGTFAGSGTTTGNYNTYIGYAAGQYPLSSNNTTAVGYQAGNTGASQSVFVGYNAGQFTTGTNNTFVGRSAGSNCNVGQGNVCIGYNAGGILGAGDNNTLIGGWGGSSNLQSNVVLSDGVGNIRFQANGSGAVGFGNASGFGTAGQVLTSSGSGFPVSWANPAAMKSTGTVASGATSTLYTITPGNGVVQTVRLFISAMSSNKIETWDVTLGYVGGPLGPNGSNTITQILNWTNPVAPEPTPDFAVTVQVSGSNINVRGAASNGAFSYSVIAFSF